MNKRILSAAAALPLALLAQTSTPPGFTDNLDAAFDAARAGGKFIYACFSGSDWCGWCRRLEREVLARTEFLDAVTNDYVLVYIDSPSDTSLLSPRAQVENPKIVERYRISGFPTALVFDANGGIVARTGYVEGGAANYARHLMEIRTRGPALRREAELADKYVKPFAMRMEALMDEMVAAYEKFVADGVAAGRSERELREESVILLPAYVPRAEALIADFKVLELPAEVAAHREREIERAEKFLASLRAEAAKAAAYIQQPPAAPTQPANAPAQPANAPVPAPAL